MIGNEEMMRYLDGELEPERARAVEEALDRSTELKRELALFRAMKTDLQAMGAGMTMEESVWTSVSRRLARPVGWILFLAGAAVWIAYGVHQYLTGTDALWEKLAVSAIVIGVLVLLLSAFLDRYVDLKTDPYREIMR